RPKKQRCRVFTIFLPAESLGLGRLAAVGAPTGAGLSTGALLISFEPGASARRGPFTPFPPTLEMRYEAIIVTGRLRQGPGCRHRVLHQEAGLHPGRGCTIRTAALGDAPAAGR